MHYTFGLILIFFLIFPEYAEYWRQSRKEAELSQSKADSSTLTSYKTTGGTDTLTKYYMGGNKIKLGITDLQIFI